MIFGLVGAPSVLDAGMTVPRIGAAALSIALTTAVLIILSASHPPAGATTLIVGLGLLATPALLAVMALGVILLTIVAWLLNRLLGIPVPVWSTES